MSLSKAAVAVLASAAPAEKVRLSRANAADWRAGRIAEIGSCMPPGRPARPPRPALRAPRDMPRRGKGGTPAGRIALLHAIAHMEFNAIDLACDIIARFGAADLPRRFHDDWVMVADEEAKHFELLCARLIAHDASYGDLVAHDGLWKAAEQTAGDILARLAVDRREQGRGLGKALLKDALLRIAGAADVIGVRAVLVLAKDEDARAFYERFDFEPSPVDPLQMFLLMKDLKRAAGFE